MIALLALVFSESFECQVNIKFPNRVAPYNLAVNNPALPTVAPRKFNNASGKTNNKKPNTTQINALNVLRVLNFIFILLVIQIISRLLIKIQEVSLTKTFKSNS
jgi:hypothetical protein